MLLVLDTQIVLDGLVFDDPALAPLVPALAAGRWRWLATDAMRDELARVLGYPLIAARLARSARSAPEVLAAFDAHAERVPAPPPATVRCRDADDQIFIDLAVARQATLISRDRAVLALRKRLLAWSVQTLSALPVLAQEPL